MIHGLFEARKENCVDLFSFLVFPKKQTNKKEHVVFGHETVNWND